MSVYPAKKLSRNMLFFNFINNGKIECENTQIKILRMGVLIKIYDLKNNLEMLFNDTYTDELLGLLKIKNGNTKLFLRKLYISDCIEVNVDKNKIIDIQIDNYLLKELGYKLEYEIIEYAKYSEESNTFINISKDIFYRTIEKNIDTFLNATNSEEENVKYNTPVTNIEYFKREVM